MFTRFLNIAIAVNDIEAAIERYREAFGWTLEGEVTAQPGLGVRTALLKAADVTVELLSPLPGEQVLRRFLDTRGEGFYRVAFATDDFAGTLAHFDANGVSYVDLSSAAGLGGRIAFTGPRSAHGLMVELIEGVPGTEPG